MELIHWEAPDKLGAQIQRGWLEEAIFKGSLKIQEELQAAKDCDCAGRISWLESQLRFLKNFGDKLASYVQFEAD